MSARGRAAFPAWLGHQRYYGLALLLVAMAALLRWALWDVLNPTPFLVFYLAWVGAAAFGGLGPGLLATLASWWCVEFLFDPALGSIGFHDMASIARLLIFLAGGLAVSVVGEAMRRSRIRARRETEELADAHAALQESEEKYRLVADNTYDWEFWLDPEDRFLYTSPSCERITGYAAHEFMSRPGLLEEIIHPEDLAAFLEHRREMLPSRHGEIEFRIIAKHDETRWIHHMCQPIYDEEGRYAGTRGSNRDITERKLAEEALRAAEEKYRFLVENSKDMTGTIDLQGKCTFVSSNVEKMTGYRADEVIGKTIWGLLTPECHDLVKENLRRRLRGEDVPPYELLVVGKDGRRIPSEVVVAPIVDNGGNIVGMQGVLRDITERKRAEEALRESEYHLAQAQQITHLGSWSWDLAADRLYWSDETYRLYGLQPGESVPRHEDFLGFVHPEDRPRVQQCVQETLAQGGSCRLDFRIVQRGGQERYVHCEAQVTLDREGHPVKAEGALQDITERKRAEEALAESRKKYRGLVEKINDWVWEIDADGVYTYASPRALELLGYAPEEIVGKTPFDFMPPAEAQRVWNAFQPTWLARKPLELLENTLVRKDGRLVTVETSGMPVFAEDGTFLGYTGVDRDVTERRRAEEALRASQSMLQSVMGNVPQGIFWKDRHSTYLGCNSVFAKATGLASAGDIVGKTDYDLPWSPEQTASYREYDRRIMENDTPEYHIIERMREASGKVAWVETNKVPLHDAQGKVIGILGTYEDITERKQAEQALRESEEKFRLLAETLPAAILIYQDGKYVYVNPAAESLTGYRRDELLPQVPGDVVHPDYRGQVKQMISRRARGEEPPAHYEVKILTKKGQERWMDSVTGSIMYGNRPAGLVVAFDITERKRAEEALRQSEEKYKRLIETTNTGYVIIDDQGRVLDANPEYTRLTGRGRVEDVVGHSVLEWTSPGDVEHNAAKVRECVERGFVRNLEIHYLAPTGQLIPVEINATVLRAGGGIQILSLVRDITERRRAAEALRQEKAFTDKLLNAPRDTVFLFEPATGKPIRWNQRFAEVSGYDDEEIAGMKAPDDFYDEDDFQKAGEAIAKILAERQGVVELSLVTKRGMHIPFEYAATVVETEDGKALLLSVGRDITEHKQAEEALRASEEKYRFLVENSKDITWMIDLRGRWTFISSNVENVVGYRVDEIIGRTIWDVLAPECHDLVRERLGRRKRGEDVPPYEVLVMDKDGRRTPFELHTAPIVDEAGNIVGVQGMSRDITERKKAEEALREWNATLESKVAHRTEELKHRARQLQELTRELSETEERERKRLAEILHDDLQQVLAAAKFQVGLLDSRVQSDAESHEIAGQTKDLLADAIAKSRSLSHELSAPALSQRDLGNAFAWLAEQMQTKHGFAVHLETEDPIEVASEPLRVLLYRAAQELLFNVIKHAGVREATLRLRCRRGRLCLSVSDKGRGFDPQQLAQAGGFGLLSIRERVDLLGGRMKIRSAVGKGSIFSITVPDTEGSS